MKALFLSFLGCMALAALPAGAWGPEANKMGACESAVSSRIVSQGYSRNVRFRDVTVVNGYNQTSVNGFARSRGWYVRSTFGFTCHESPKGALETVYVGMLR
jgi:hypothetical protein